MDDTNPNINLLSLDRETINKLMDTMAEKISAKLKEDFKRPQSRWLSPIETMNFLQISRNTLTKYANEGKIHRYRPSDGKILYDRFEINEYIKSTKEK